MIGGLLLLPARARRRSTASPACAAAASRWRSGCAGWPPRPRRSCSRRCVARLLGLAGVVPALAGAVDPAAAEPDVARGGRASALVARARLRCCAGRSGGALGVPRRPRDGGPYPVGAAAAIARRRSRCSASRVWIVNPYTALLLVARGAPVAARGRARGAAAARRRSLSLVLAGLLPFALVGAVLRRAVRARPARAGVDGAAAGRRRARRAARGARVVSLVLGVRRRRRCRSPSRKRRRAPHRRIPTTRRRHDPGAAVLRRAWQPGWNRVGLAPITLDRMRRALRTISTVLILSGRAAAARRRDDDRVAGAGVGALRADHPGPPRRRPAGPRAAPRRRRSSGACCASSRRAATGRRSSRGR